MENQQQGERINMDLVVAEYRNRLNAFMEENVMMGAYIKQLEGKLREQNLEQKTVRNEDVEY